MPATSESRSSTRFNPRFANATTIRRLILLDGADAAKEFIQPALPIEVPWLEKQMGIPSPDHGASRLQNACTER
jgi:hypothetical protein